MSQSLATNRAIRDASLSANIALPNANAVTYSAAIDLGQPNAFCVNETFDIRIVVPNTNIVSAKTTTITLEHADVNLNANFAAVAAVGIVNITGVTGNVSVAADTIVKVPGAVKQFLRLRGDGGANSGTTLTEICSFRLEF